MKLAVLASAAAAAGAVMPTVPLCAPETKWNPSRACYNIPVVGEGSCCGAYNITSALLSGFNHIDTSTDYGSQPAIGDAIRSLSIAPSSVWITSKLNVEDCSSDMSAAFDAQILKPLGTGFTKVNLLLLHHAGRHQRDNNPHPPCFNASDANIRGTYYTCRIQTIEAFEKLRAAGKIDVWGVSNWGVKELQQAYDYYGFYPPLNQIEISPQFKADEIISFCNRHGIAIEAYAPFGDGDRSHIRDSPAFPPIATRHNTTVGKVMLAWALQVGADIVLPRSHNLQHQTDNVHLFDPAPLMLNETEVAIISTVKPASKVYDTECSPWC